jgi:hypothetical protein
MSFPTQRLLKSTSLFVVLLAGAGCRDLLGINELEFDDGLSRSDAAAASPSADRPSVGIEPTDGGAPSPSGTAGSDARSPVAPPGPSSTSDSETAPSAPRDPDAGSPVDSKGTKDAAGAGGSGGAPVIDTAGGGGGTDTDPVPTTSVVPAATQTSGAGGSPPDGQGGSTPSNGGNTAAGGDTTAGGNGGSTQPQPELDDESDPACELDVTSLAEDFSDAARFDDELAQGCWASFNEHRLGYAGVDERDSVFRALPNANTGWYQATTGPLFYRATTGNFVIESDVTTSAPTDDASPPGERWSGGALLVYDPASTLGVDDTYYLIGTGRLEGSNTGIKSEATEAPQTLQTLDMAMSHSNRLRICRLGATVYTLYAPLGTDDWSFFTYDTSTSLMPDLPQRVYVGFAAFQYTPGGANVTQVEFDHLRISTAVQSFSDCTAPLP